MKDIQDISAFWKAHNNSDLVLATIVRKTGSAYRQPGAKKVISTYGADAGYLSGGCLEGEINRTACEGFSKLPFVKSFSTMSDEDRLMGYQTGCAGEIAILFERLPDYNQENVKTYLAYGLDDCAGVRVELDDQKLGQRHFVESEQDCEDDACFFDAAVRPVALNVIGAGPNSRPFSELCKTSNPPFLNFTRTL